MHSTFCICIRYLVGAGVPPRVGINFKYFTVCYPICVVTMPLFQGFCSPMLVELAQSKAPTRTSEFMSTQYMSTGRSLAAARAGYTSLRSYPFVLRAAVSRVHHVRISTQNLSMRDELVHLYIQTSPPDISLQAWSIDSASCADYHSPDLPSTC